MEMYINIYEYTTGNLSYQKNPFTENMSSLCLSIGSNKIGRSGFKLGIISYALGFLSQ